MLPRRVGALLVVLCSVTVMAQNELLWVRVDGVTTTLAARIDGVWSFLDDVPPRPLGSPGVDLISDEQQPLVNNIRPPMRAYRGLEGFNRLRWAMPAKEARKHLPSGARQPEANMFVWRANIAGYNAEVTCQFVLDRLAEVTLLFDRADHESLESMLLAKYGSAKRIGLLTYFWRTDESTIVLGMDHFRSRLTYASRVMEVFLEQHRLEENRAKAKDL